MRAQFRLFGMEREKPDAVSGADGTFVVAGLSPGSYAALVSRAGFASKSVGSLAVTASGENHWPPITLLPGLPIAGFVHDSAGQAVAGARVFALDPGAGVRLVDASRAQTAVFGSTACRRAAVDAERFGGRPRRRPAGGDASRGQRHDHSEELRLDSRPRGGRGHQDAGDGLRRGHTILGGMRMRLPAMAGTAATKPSIPRTAASSWATSLRASGPCT